MADSVGDGICVLYADDDADAAESTAAVLEREAGFTVETVGDARAGLDRLDAGDIDCVVSDYELPDRTGVEFLRTVRERSPDLPFVLYTGAGSEVVASEAISAGVTDYLRKDGHADEHASLANRIRTAVERYRAKRARRRRLDAIETAQEGIAILDGGEFVYVNEAYAALYDYDPTDLVGEGWERLYPDDQMNRIREEVLPQVEAEGRWHGETIGLRADGSTFAEDHRLTTTDRGELVCSVRDVSDRRERDRLFEAVFDNTYTFSGLVSPDGTVIEANETALEFAGVDREAVVGEPLWEACWFEATESARQAARKGVRQARSGELYRDEIRLQGSDREAVVDFSIRPITNEQGEVTALVPEGRDITERKRRERELRRSERRLEAVFEDPQMLVGVLSPDGRLRKANRTAMAFVDADHEDLVGQPFPETPWWSEEMRSEVEAWIERAADGEYVEYDAAHSRSETDRRSVNGTIRPVTDASGTIVSLIVSARDTTERRDHERELKRRNDRLNEFTSLVSHDLRNPLNVATGHLSVVRRDAESDHLDETAHALDRMGDLIEDLLTLAQAGERVSDFETVDLAETVRECWRNVSMAGTAIDVETECSIRADRSQLQHLLENLFRNSVEHGSSSQSATDEVSITVGECEDGFYVADDGPGIPESDRDAVFESGYSTSNDGTGFGLSIVAEIADAHDWEIAVAESAAGGTRFEITGVVSTADLPSAD